MPVNSCKRNLQGYAGGEPRYRAARARCAIACRKFNALPEDALQTERAAAWADIVCYDESSSRLLKESSACPARLSAALASPSPSASTSPSPSLSPSPATPSWMSDGSALPQIGSQPCDAGPGASRVAASRFPDESPSRFNDPAANSTAFPRDRHANLFPGFGSTPFVKAPIFVDYGANVRIGGTTFINRNCHILDTPVTSVEIGERCLFGPNVHLYGVTHTLDAAKRSDPSYDASSLAGDIKIGNDCWIGGNATILPGVTIGEGSVIGAGSVVTRDVPAHHLAVGVPARVMRKLDQSGNDNIGPGSRLLYAIMQLWKSRSAVPRLGHFPTMRSLETKLIGLECTIFILLVAVAWLLYLEVTKYGG